MLLLCSIHRFPATFHSASAPLFAKRATPRLRCSGVWFSSAVNDKGKNHDIDLLSTTSGRTGRTQMPPRQRMRRRTHRRGLRPPLDSDKNITMPSLSDFIHRAKVLKQYRHFVRLAKFVDGKERRSDVSGQCGAALEEVRLSFKLNMKKDLDAISKNMTYSDVSFYTQMHSLMLSDFVC